MRSFLNFPLISVAQVNISTRSYFAYCLRYTYSKINESNKALIIGASVAGAVVVLLIICLVIAISVIKKRKAKEKEIRRKKVLEYDKISTEGERTGTELSMEVSKDESQQEIEAHELTNNSYLEVIEDNASEISVSQRSKSDYLIPTTYETDVKTIGATVHPEMTSYGNSLEQVAEHPREQIENAELQKFQYEPDDPALKFDLTRLRFQEEVFKLPRLRIEGGDKKPKNIISRQT